MKFKAVRDISEIFQSDDLFEEFDPIYTCRVTEWSCSSLTMWLLAENQQIGIG